MTARYSASAPQQTGRSSMPSEATQFWLSGPVIAVAAAVCILVVAGLVLLATRNSNSRDSKPIIIRKQEPNDIKNDDNPVVVPTANESASNPNNDNAGANYAGDAGRADLSSIESLASRVLISISKDTHPVLTEKPLSEINAQVQRYKGSSSLRDELQAMKHALPQVSAAAKANGVRTPLAVYTTLALIDKDGRGDPAQVAGQICPTLAKMRAIFGDELANDSVLSVAALEEGTGLQSKITKLGGRVNDSPSTIRSIWYLHDHQIVTSETYAFVLRFLAIGVIAQDPQKFGIAADPLTF